MKYAIVENETVVNITNILPEDEVAYEDATGFQLEKIGNMPVAIGWEFVNGSFVDPVVEDNNIYLSVSMSGGDGDTPIGIINDGVSFVTINYQIEDALGNVLPIPDAKYRITIRDSDGATYDVISVPFVSGAGSIDYTSDMRPAIVSLDASDLSIPGMDVTVQLKQKSVIKIYREM